MKVFKKIATFTCGAIALVCLAIGGVSTLTTNVTHAASKGGYIVQGGSVRLVDDAHGAGVKFHVIMTLEEFDNYGTIDGDKLTLDSGYTTGTVILPYSLLKGDELTVGYVASNGAKAHCEPTTNLWKKVTIGGIDYAESVVYLYNIPDTDYGTEIAVRGVIFKNDTPIKYTEQENGISMSFVADAEYNDKNTQLDASQLESLHDEYLKKEITIVANGETTTQTVNYLDYVSEQVVPARQDDGDEFVGLYTASGKEITFEDAVKNHITAYARYRESIVLSDATPSFELGNYKRNASDTVTSMTFTAADGTTYDLGSNPAAVTVDTLKTAYADHGEGTVTAVLNDGAKDYTLTLPALVVTADLTSSTFTTVINYNGSSYYDSTSTTLDGYFRLKENVTLTSMTVDGYGNVTGAGVNGTGGFIGTLDGLGYTISGGWTSGGGVFGAIGSGAVIKNTNFNSPYPHNGSCAVLAYAIYGATLENLTITSTSVSNYDEAAAPGDYLGYLAAQGMRASTVRNVTVNASGSIKSLFGGAGNKNYNRGTANSYQGFYVNATHVDYIGTGTKDGEKHHYTIAEEVAAGGIIIYNGEGNWKEENVTLTERQDFVFNGTTKNTEFALDLEGQDKGYTVQSITFNGVNLGTNPRALDVSTLKTSASSHGEGNVIVTMIGGVTKKTVTVPVTFITREILSTDEFLSTFALKTDNTYYTYPSIIGYFRLANDIGNETWVFANNNRYDRYNTHGFRGTFDGNGYTITGQTGAGGLFECIGAGALIKDLTIINTGHTGNSHKAVLALAVCGAADNPAVLENVNIKFQPVAETADYLPWYNKSTGNAAQGWLTSWGVFGVTFRNVTIDASSIAHRTNGYRLSSVFGRMNNDCYEYSNGTHIPNNYESLILKGRFTYEDVDLSEMGCLGYDAINGKVVTVADEIASGANIIFNDAGWTETTVTLEGRQEFLMSDASFSIDIGEYANQRITSIKLGETDLGTDVDSLDMLALRTNYASHGEKTIVVTCIDGKNKTTVNVPVLLLTREISTESELMSMLTFTENNKYFDTTAKAIFGCFRLTADIYVSSWTNNPGTFTHVDKTQGFRGMLDGAGHTLSAHNAGAWGLFSSIGEGAVIKNVNITHAAYYNGGYVPILGNYIQGATLENVTITTNSTQNYDATKSEEAKYTQIGYLAINGASGSTFRNVTINTNGDIYTLFGGYEWKGYEKTEIGQNVYDNFVINATTVDYIGFGVDGSSNRTFVTIAEEQEDPDNYIIYNGDDGKDLEDAEFTQAYDLVLNGENKNHTLDLGEYADLAVRGITLTTADGSVYDLGTDVSALDVSVINTKANYADHGEGATIVVETQKNFITFTNVSVVTYEITKATSFQDNTAGLFMFNDTNPYFDTETKTIDGYYTLGESISFWSTPNNSQIEGGLSYDNPSHGFIGTFDGRGYTIDNYASGQYGAASTRGFFGQLGIGAVVKNTNFIVNTYTHSQYSAVLATAAYSATFENITVSTTTVTGHDGTVASYIGFLTTNSISGCTFNNVTVELNGQQIESLFGGRTSNGYEYDSKGGQNTYNNFVVNGTVDYMGTGASGNVTINDEMFSGEGIIYNGKSMADFVEDVILTENQDIVLNGTYAASKQALDLGEYAAYGAKEITYYAASGTDYDLGLNPSALNVSALQGNYADHGVGTVVIVTKYDTTITVPVTVVTAQIVGSDLNQNTAGLFMFNDTNPYFNTETKTVDGYYTLGENISFWNTPNNSQIDGGLSYDNPAHGFIGTFDGRGFTMTHTQGGQWPDLSTRGLFGQLGSGAVVKDVTMVMTTYTHRAYATVLATSAYNATFENLTVTMLADGVTGQNGAVADAEGFLTTSSISGCTFNNVTIELNGQHIDSLFGGRSWNGYEFDEKGGQNTYNNFVVNGTVDYIGKSANGNVTIVEEIFSGEDITYNGKKFADFIEDVELKENQDIVLNGANAASKQALDLGEYAAYGAKEITYYAASGTDYDLGSNPAALSVSALQGNYADHGVGTVVVLTNYDTTITVPVTVVTFEITKATSFQDNTAGLFMFNDTNPYFDTETKTIDGYYTLGESISFWSTPNNSQIEGGLSYDNPSHGFIGTFDGRGYTIDNYASGQYGAASTRGFFGQLGIGAVVKNTNFIVNTYSHSQYSAVFATAAYDATFEDITVSTTTVTGYDGTIAHLTGYLTAHSISGCTFNNVTVELNGQHIESLFGGRSSNGYEEDFSAGGSVFPGQNVYNNLVVNGTVDYIGTGHDLNKAEYNFTIEEEIMAGAGITYNGKTFENYLPNTNYLAAKDGNGNWYSDYTIVYDASNADMEELVDFLRDQIQRATGGVTYAKGSNGQFTETVGGLQLRKAAGATWNANARYIVIGNEDMRNAAGLATPVTSGYDYTIQEVGNSVFIFSNNEEEYVSAILRFLEEAIGYNGLSDDYVVYNDINGLNLADKLTQTINGKVALANRESTRGILKAKEEVLGVNARMSEVWTVMPDLPTSGVDHLSKDYFSTFHNSILWVPKAEATGSDVTNWFTTANDDGEYDLCYTARGNAESYSRMVAKAAEKIYAKLVAAGASATKNVSVTFSIMDDWSYDACTCSTCSSYNDTALMLNFLTDVAERIEAKDSEMLFTIYALAYHCYEGPATAAELNTAAAQFNYDSDNKKTILDANGQLNEHLGVIYAPSPSPNTDNYKAAAAQSIYATVNDQIRANMAAWDALTDNVGIWFYNTYFNNYMMPFGSFSSMLTWIEYAARLFEDDNMVWSFVQGQHSPRMTTGFDAFKTYMVQKAQIEILDKVTTDIHVDGRNDAKYSTYDTQIADYLLELEQEFFGFTGDGSAEGNFTDKGYYGPAAANYNMYQFYQKLKSEYAAMIGNKKAATYDAPFSSYLVNSANYTTTMIGSTNESYDYIRYGNNYAKFDKWLTSGTDSNTYFANWTKSQINTYLGYVENAMVAVTKMTSVNGNKDVYLQHVMLESLFPRFVICNGNHSSYWYNGYAATAYNWYYNSPGSATITLANMRSAFKMDCDALGITKYSEGGALSAVYAKWGIS